MISSEILIFIFAWFIGSLLNGIAGLGAAMVALPIVSSFMPSHVIVPVSSSMMIVIGIMLAWDYRKYAIYKSLIPMYIGAIPGAIIGVNVLLLVPSEVIQFCAGIVMLCFVAFQIIPKKHQNNPENKFIAALAGFISSFVHTTISFGGPPVAMYCLYVGWDKKTTFANINIFIVITSFFTSAAHISGGLYTEEVIKYIVIAAITCVIGLITARPIARRVNTQTFVKLLLFVIAVSAVVCIVRSLT